MGSIKRLITSWSFVINEHDIALVEKYLDEPGKFLFYQMNRFDQHHCLTVARDILVKHQTTLKDFEMNLLMKAALLHDIGKSEGEFDLINRILVALIRRFFPFWRNRLALTNPSTWWEQLRYGVYLDLVHPARGAHMAQLLGINPVVVELIQRHHEPRQRSQSLGLKYLQAADKRN